MAKGRAYIEWVRRAEKRQDSFEYGFILIEYFDFVRFIC